MVPQSEINLGGSSEDVSSLSDAFLVQFSDFGCDLVSEVLSLDLDLDFSCLTSRKGDLDLLDERSLDLDLLGGVLDLDLFEERSLDFDLLVRGDLVLLDGVLDLDLFDGVLDLDLLGSVLELVLLGE